MSKKGYTKVEREQVGRDLLTVGLEMLSQRGLKGTTLQDILQAVGISSDFQCQHTRATILVTCFHPQGQTFYPIFLTPIR